MSRFTRWVQIWDARERPDVLAVVRLLVGAVVLYDLITVVELDLTAGLYAPLEAGGMGNPLGRSQVPGLYRWFEPSVGTATAATWLAMAAAGSFMVGAGTRMSALILVLTWAQLASVLPPADRGIDMLLRNVLVILMCSGCGQAWSLDARLRTGRWQGSGAQVPAWPRLLLVCQLLVVYGTAGVQKVGISWLPMGEWSALYIVLRDPAFGLLSLSTLDRFYGLTQVATGLSWLWEWATPLAALAWWYRATRQRSGRLRAWMNSHGFYWKWVCLGACFHLGTAATMQLGVFPFGMLALYPCFFHPDTWRSLKRKKPPATG